MKFQTRHFVAVAESFRPLVEKADLFDQPVIVRTINHFADLFADDNPRFNRDRFLRACGLVASLKPTKGQ